MCKDKELINEPDLCPLDNEVKLANQKSGELLEESTHAETQKRHKRNNSELKNRNYSNELKNERVKGVKNEPDCTSTNKIPSNINSNHDMNTDTSTGIHHNTKTGNDSLFKNSDNSIKNKGRNYTISIAVPVSILGDTAGSAIQQTCIIGQVARAACIYSVDEIIIFNDGAYRNFKQRKNELETHTEMMKVLLEYQECPQYLRKSFFSVQPHLQYVGFLNPLNAPHHLLYNEWCTYREGVTLPVRSERISLVNVGFQHPVPIHKKLEPGLRVTVKFPPAAESMEKKIGCIVSPNEPRTKEGLYWGYTVRVASTLAEVFKNDQLPNGYDLVIGTSDKGKNSDEVTFSKFTHALIVFGSVMGLEAALEADEALCHSDLHSVFPYYLNVCPNQSSRTIRTEEALLIALCNLYPKLTTAVE